jgi:ATP-dependent DNA helicase RecG
LRADSLEDLVNSIDRPLRFAREADESQRGRIHLPVRAWIERVEGARRSHGAASPQGRTLAAIANLLEELEPDRSLGRLDLVDELLARLRELVPGGSARPAAGPEARSTAPPARARAGAAGRSPASEVAIVEPAAEPPAPKAAEVEVRESSPEAVDRYLRIAAAPATRVSGVGDARARELERFGIRTVEDVLYHLPFRYDDRRERRTIREIRAGDTATVVVEIDRVDERPMGRTRRTVLSALARDPSGRLELVWFHQIRWFKSRVRAGQRYVAHGRVEPGWDGPLRIVHPELEPAEEGEHVEPAGGRVLPVYEKPTAMPVATMRRIVAAAVKEFADSVPDAVPPEVRKRLGLLPLARALRVVHVPGADADANALAAARSEPHRALVFDELFFVQMGLLRRKGAVAREPGIAFRGPGDLVRRMVAGLPFALTRAQERVIAEIATDMALPHPMHRLLQGDVGSGKTVVAVASALRAIEEGYQAVIMAPTELLAEQHWQTVQTALAPLGVAAWVLTGEGRTAQRRDVLARLAAGEPGLAVGTHALIQEGVELPRLGLAVIDEQHRFGVQQRALLTRGSGGLAPDVLLMTATPIPRTLALSVFGDLDLSSLDELPPNRKPVATRVFSVGQRARAYEAVRREIAAGRQAYVVYPLIEESEKSDLRDATNAARELAEAFPDLAIALIHGRMPAAERDQVMRAFKDGRHQVLVATTVIEVGIDVPNATVIVVEHAERFGLSQLHQLRGRVGRGAERSYCFLVADYAQSRESRERLRVMTETQDGLRIAEADLAIRGPGTLLGTRQSGLPDFRVANLMRDAAILVEARAAAEGVLRADPELGRPESQVIARVLEARWAGRLGLARVG